MSDDHLTDEVLSAVLDGEATPAEARHASSCAMCGLRLAELQQAASLIGSPVPPVDPARRDAAIAAALAARAVPMESRRRRLPTWALGAAALVLAVLALVPLVMSGDDDDADMAADAPEMSLRADDSAGSTGGGSAGPVALGDLGAVDGTVLAERVQGALAVPAADTTAADETTSAAPAAGAAQESAEAVPCAAELAESTPGLGELRATGVAEVGGRRASVLAYASADGRIRVLAVAVDACDDVLLSVSFPAPQP
jgi:hypothetical protein